MIVSVGFEEPGETCRLVAQPRKRLSLWWSFGVTLRDSSQGSLIRWTYSSEGKRRLRSQRQLSVCIGLLAAAFV